MRLRYFHLDAFGWKPFTGNPAGVVPLEKWLPTSRLQAIAAENNLSETAFLVRTGETSFAIRWFTPAVEVDLCGHATLAAAQVVRTHLVPGATRLEFSSKSGPLLVTARGSKLVLNFPAWPGKRVDPPAALIRGLGKVPRVVYKARDYLAIFGREEDVRALKPDFPALAEVESLGVIISAHGRECDFVSRFFAPRAGILEDPVTGSAHCMLTPYWATALGKEKLTARQLSARGGRLTCQLAGDRVLIGGQVRAYLEGTIDV